MKIRYLIYILLGFITNLSLYSQVTANFTVNNDKGCSPLVVKFANTSSGSGSLTYIWDFGKGGAKVILTSKDTLIEAFSNSGTYTVKLTVTNGIDTAVKTQIIQSYKKPTASFNTESKVFCIPYFNRYYDLSVQGDAPITGRHWDFRDGTHQYNTTAPFKDYQFTGTYDVFLEVTDANGCKASIEKTKYVKGVNQPIANFVTNPNNPKVCAPPLTVTYTAVGINAFAVELRSVLKYNWTFGTGATPISSTLAIPPSVFYNSFNTFPAQLTVRIDSVGCYAQSAITTVLIQDVVGDFDIKQNGRVFGPTDTLCLGNVTFVSKITGSSIKKWDIPGWGTFSSDSVTISLPSIGKYSLTLFAGTGTCADTVKKSFVVQDFIADFSLDKNYACSSPLLFRATDHTSKAAAWDWSICGTKFTTKAPPNYMFFAQSIDSMRHDTAVYKCMVRLTASNRFGCKSKDSASVRIVLPTARIIPDKIEGCLPLTINFTDSSKSVENITNRIWIFGDGSNASNNNTLQSHTYTTEGEFWAKLVIINSTGCRDTSYAIKIKVGKRLNPDFSMSSTSVCSNDSILFTDLTPLSDSIDSWFYYSTNAGLQTKGSANPNPRLKLKPISAGFSSVSLTVGYNGCFSDTTFNNILYVRGPVISFTDKHNCDSPLVKTYDPILSSTSAWIMNFGDSKIDSNKVSFNHKYAVPGNYNVVLTARNDSNMCRPVFSSIIKVRLPNAAFSTNTVLCSGDTLLLNASSSTGYIDSCYIEPFLWEFNDNSKPIRTIHKSTKKYISSTSLTKIKLTVLAENGCTDTLSQPVNVYRPNPIFTINDSTGCAPVFPVTFTNPLVDLSLVSWKWYPGTGDSIVNDTSFIYNYTVTKTDTFISRIVVTDSHGCTNQSKKNIYIFKPNASFTTSLSKTCSGKNVLFNAAYNTPDSLKWLPGDGNTIKRNDTSYLHTYATRGVFSPTLILFEGGCSDTLTRANIVSIQLADARFSVSDTISDCYPNAVTFTHINSPDTIKSGNWVFRQGYPPSVYGKTALFTYTQPGTYHTQLWIETTGGCKDTSDLFLTVTGPKAHFKIYPITACKGDSVTFTVDTISGVKEFSWAFGDGQNAGQDTSIVHKYNQTGKFIPTLVIKNDNCTPPAVEGDTLEVFTVEASFSIPDSILCLGTDLSVLNNSIGTTSQLWDFGNGVTWTIPNPPKVAYSNSGFYIINLYVSNNKGCKDTAFKFLQVKPLPTATITASDTIVCAGKSLSMTATTNPTNTIIWTPSIYFSNPTSLVSDFRCDTLDFVNTRLQVTDIDGCNGFSNSKKITIIPFPIYKFNPSTRDTVIVIDDTLKLNVVSNYPSIYKWSPSDGFSCTDCSNPYVFPKQNTTYTVTVSNNCFVDVFDFKVEVKELYSVGLPKAFTPTGDEKNKILYVKGRGIKELLEFSIYNRWGNLIFRTQDLNVGWDGTYKGTLQNSDTYTYYIKVITNENKEIEKKGTVHLLR